MKLEDFLNKEKQSSTCNTSQAKDEIIETLLAALDQAKKELGVPQPGYPAPVANAYEVLNIALLKANELAAGALE